MKAGWISRGLLGRRTPHKEVFPLKKKQKRGSPSPSFARSCDTDQARDDPPCSAVYETVSLPATATATASARHTARASCHRRRRRRRRRRTKAFHDLQVVKTRQMSVRSRSILLYSIYYRSPSSPRAAGSPHQRKLFYVHSLIPHIISVIESDTPSLPFHPDPFPYFPTILAQVLDIKAEASV